MPTATGKRPVYWMGSTASCDICKMPLGKRIIDGKTNSGLWALMDPACHRNHGRGLGVGFGQAYEKQDDGRYLKVEG
jgi:hypothetical protein